MPDQPNRAGPGMVGVMMLPNTKVTGDGSITDPAGHIGSLTQLTASHRPLDGIIGGQAEADYVAAAGALAAAGADLLTSNCGLSAIYQDAVRAATGTPTMMSALLLVPLAVRVFGPPVAVVAFGADHVREQLRALYPGDPLVDQVEVISVQGAGGLEWLGNADSAPPDWAAAARAVSVDIGPRIVRTNATAVVIECTAMLPLIEAIRKAAPLPTLDVSGFLRYLQAECLGWRPAAVTT